MTLLVLLLVVGVGGVIVDRLARSYAEGRVHDEIAHMVEGDSEVVIDGFPFLTQLWRSEFTEVRLSADVVVVESLRVSDVHLTARGVEPGDPARAGRVELNAVIPPETIEVQIEEFSGLGGITVTTSETGIAFAVEALGQDLVVELVPQPAGRALELDVSSLALGGVGVGVEQLPNQISGALTGLRVDLDELPAGLEVTRIATGDGGVEVRLEGTDVELEPDDLP